MAENTSISWCDDTFNPWIGCARVSPACDGCYAAYLMDSRMHRVVWGEPGKGEGTRDRTGEDNWKDPLRWNRKYAATPGQRFIFCASLADVFDNHPDLPPWRRELFQLIAATPNLTWLLLTKRPGNIVKLTLEACAGMGVPPNIALGATFANQDEWDRDHQKLRRAAEELLPRFTFASVEPILGPIVFGNWMPDQVIVGGETDQGKHMARVHDPLWMRMIKVQCETRGKVFHLKQHGEWQPARGDHHLYDGIESVRVPSGELMCRYGKDHDPCTLDGRFYQGRPEVLA